MSYGQQYIPFSTYLQAVKATWHRNFTNVYVSHIMSILLSVFAAGHRGKTVNFEKHSSCHRTTIGHFLNFGKWDSAKLEDILKQAVTSIIYAESRRTGKPVYCIIDDTITSKTKPSSKASHPIEDAGQQHLLVLSKKDRQ